MDMILVVLQKQLNLIDDKTADSDWTTNASYFTNYSKVILIMIPFISSCYKTL